MRIQILAERLQLEPGALALQRVEHALEIAFVVDPLIGVRPQAELLPVVGVGDRDLTSPFAEPCEKADEVLRDAERNQIAEIFADREDRQRVAFFFRQVIPRQAARGEPCVHEMRVVQDRVPQPRRDELFRQQPLPGALGEPEPPRGCAETAVQPAREQRDLAYRVTVRDDREDRLVETAAEDLDLVSHDELREPVEERWLLLLEPLQQWPRVVQRQPDVRVPLQEIEEWPVAALVRLAEDMGEVSHRLVVVNAQQQRYRVHVRPSTWCPRRSDRGP